MGWRTVLAAVFLVGPRADAGAGRCRWRPRWRRRADNRDEAGSALQLTATRKAKPASPARPSRYPPQILSDDRLFRRPEPPR
jgi:hypothetical protein